MSLLLDARKKSKRTASGAEGGLFGQNPRAGDLADTASSSPDSPDFENSRSAGRNLFNAKNPASPLARTGINRNLLIALGGTVLLLSAGGAYVWYVVSAANSQPPRPVTPTVAATSIPAPITPAPQNNLVPETGSPQAGSPSTTEAAQTVEPPRPAARRPLSRTTKSKPLHIAQQAEAIDPLLNNAYLAYRSGKFDQAQQQYREALKLDARNMDALLGLAVIAQHRGSDNEAAHYYSQALTLDPRNAVANAGISALSTDENRESRLKNLLYEQKDSSSLHFALGNLYADQARWGEAQLSYSNAYRLEPDNAGLAFNLAVSLDRLGQKQPAALYYQRAMQLDQSHSAGFDHAQIEQRVQELSR